jgi:hypothetical protein
MKPEIKIGILGQKTKSGEIDEAVSQAVRVERMTQELIQGKAAFADHFFGAFEVTQALEEAQAILGPKWKMERVRKTIEVPGKACPEAYDFNGFTLYRGRLIRDNGLIIAGLVAPRHSYSSSKQQLPRFFREFKVGRYVSSYASANSVDVFVLPQKAVVPNAEEERLLLTSLSDALNSRYENLYDLDIVEENVERELLNMRKFEEVIFPKTGLVAHHAGNIRNVLVAYAQALK